MKNNATAVLLSIQPEWCGLIANRKKTIEIRKTRPKLGEPFKCYIYCTEGDSLAYPCANNPKFDIHRMNNGSLLGRRMTAKEREHSDHLYANGKVIGEFVCESIALLKADNSLRVYYNNPQGTCLTNTEIIEYAKGGKVYYWYMSNLVVYDKPKELSEFGLKRPPQSWCYVIRKCER